MAEIIKQVLRLLGSLIGALVTLVVLSLAVVGFIGICIFVLCSELAERYDKRKKKFSVS